MPPSLSSYAGRLISGVSDFIHRSAEPVDNDGATKQQPSFLSKAVEDIHEEVVRGRPFSLSDLVRIITLSFCPNTYLSHLPLSPRT